MKSRLIPLPSLHCKIKVCEVKPRPSVELLLSSQKRNIDLIGLNNIINLKIVARLEVQMMGV